MVKINDGERAALEDIFVGFSSDRLRVTEKIVQFFKRIFS
jgi:hypothetical protein